MNSLLQGWTFSCSPAELYTMASLLGGDTLIGVSDPFPGWLTEEIQEAMERSLNSLTDRGVLIRRGKNEIIMDVSVAALVAPLAAPQSVFIVTLTASDQVFRQLTVYYKAPLLVVLSAENELWNLQPVSDVEAMLKLIREFWQLDYQNAAHSQAISMPESVVQAALKSRAEGESEVLKQLTTSNVFEQSAQILAHTLTTARRNGSLVAINNRRGVWTTGGLGMLEGDNGLWMLRSFSRQQTPWVECIPRSSDQLMDEVAALIHRFLPLQEQ